MAIKVKRSNILKTAKSLLTRTESNGCTEAEAAEARKKLAEVMRDHRLSLGEIKSGKRHKTVHFYTHNVVSTPPLNYHGRPVPARAKQDAQIERPHNTYRLYGLDFLKHPWHITHDYSRIRALARDASIRWPSHAAQVIQESPRVGFLPIVQFYGGRELRWRGA